MRIFCGREKNGDENQVAKCEQGIVVGGVEFAHVEWKNRLSEEVRVCGN